MELPTQKIPTGYKHTEIGVIPADWAVKKLGDCLMKPPRYGIGAAAVEYSDSLPKYIRITDISEDGRFLPGKTVSVNNVASVNYFLAEGDLVVARTGASVGKSYLYKPKDGPLVFAGFLICLTPSKDVLLPQYLSAYLKTTSYWNWVKLTSMRSGQPGINGNEYARILIPLPEVAEQNTISEALSETDALIEKLQNLLEKKTNIKQGAMQELLTGKRRLPGFSGEWGKKRIGNIAKIEKGRGLSKGKISPSGQYQCILYGELFTTYDEAIIKVISKTDCEEGVLSKYGDVLVPGSTTTTGIDLAKASVLLVEKVFLGGDINIIRGLSDTYDSVFLAYCLTHIYKNDIAQKTKGVTIYHLHGKDLLDLDIKMPDKTEQAAIAVILSDIDAEIQGLESQLTKYQNLKQGMMQVLLTGKIRLLSN